MNRSGKSVRKLLTNNEIPAEGLSQKTSQPLRNGIWDVAESANERDVDRSRPPKDSIHFVLKADKMILCLIEKEAKRETRDMRKRRYVPITVTLAIPSSNPTPHK
jgi:hypothetical protein